MIGSTSLLNVTGPSAATAVAGSSRHSSSRHSTRVPFMSDLEVILVQASILPNNALTALRSCIRGDFLRSKPCKARDQLHWNRLRQWEADRSLVVDFVRRKLFLERRDERSRGRV